MKINNVTFAGTYLCNTDCDYCYADKYISPFQGVELSLEKFKNLLNRLKDIGVTHIRFIGGEPSIWKYINEAIAYAKSIGIHTTVLTNGMVRLKEIPDNLYIHLNVLFLTKNKNILKNIIYYSQKTKVSIDYNIHDINKFNINIIKSVITKLNLPIFFNVIFDKKNMTFKTGEYLYELLKYTREILQLPTEMVHTLPKCIFTEEQFHYINNSVGVHDCFSTLSIFKDDNFFVINPDGETFYPNPTLPDSFPINELFSDKLEAKLDKLYKDLKNHLIVNQLDFCKGCEWYLKGCNYPYFISNYSIDEVK